MNTYRKNHEDIMSCESNGDYWNVSNAQNPLSVKLLIQHNTIVISNLSQNNGGNKGNAIKRRIVYILRCRDNSLQNVLQSCVSILFLSPLFPCIYDQIYTNTI